MTPANLMRYPPLLPTRPRSVSDSKPPPVMPVLLTMIAFGRGAVAGGVADAETGWIRWR